MSNFYYFLKLMTNQFEKAKICCILNITQTKLKKNN